MKKFCMIASSVVIALSFLCGCGKERRELPEREYRKRQPNTIQRYDTRDITANHQLIK